MMNSESTLFGCLGLWLTNPVLLVFAMMLQFMVNIFFGPLSLLGITAPDLQGSLLGGACGS